MNALPSPATTAKSEFERRRAAWQQAGAGQGGPASRSAAVGPTRDAEANLSLWLAIACAAGCADRQSEGYCEALEWHRPVRVFPAPSASSSAAVGQQMMSILPDWIAPEADWKAELLRARDALFARAVRPDATPEQHHRAAAVAQLARHLHCEHPQQIERKAA